MYKNTPRTIEQLKDAIRQEIQAVNVDILGKVFQNLEKHIQVFGCERRPVSALIMNRSCFASFPVCVYKFSSHYVNNIFFYRQYFRASSERLTLYMNLGTTRLRRRPRNRWQDEVSEIGRIVGGEGWQGKVHNREEWKKLLRMAKNRHILHMPTE